MELVPNKKSNLLRIDNQLKSLYRENLKLQRVHENHMIENLFEIKKELSEKTLELKETKELLHMMKMELKFAKSLIKQKNEYIDELENFIRVLNKDQEKDDSISDSSDNEDASDGSRKQAPIIHTNSGCSGKRDLSPIPEENPDEIPDYFDVM